MPNHWLTKQFFSRVYFSHACRPGSIYNATAVYVGPSYTQTNGDYEQAVNTFKNSTLFKAYQQQLVQLYVKLKAELGKGLDLNEEQRRSEVSEAKYSLQTLINRMHNIGSKPEEDYILASDGKAALERLYLQLYGRYRAHYHQLVLDLFNSDVFEENAVASVTNIDTVASDIRPLFGVPLLAHTRNKLAESVANGIVEANGLAPPQQQMNYTNALMNQLSHDYALTPRVSTIAPDNIHAVFRNKFEQSFYNALHSFDFIESLASNIKSNVTIDHASIPADMAQLKDVLSSIGQDVTDQPFSLAVEFFHLHDNTASHPADKWRDKVLCFHLLRRLVGGGYMHFQSRPLGRDTLYLVGNNISVSFVVEPNGQCRDLMNVLFQADAFSDIDFFERFLDTLSSLGPLKEIRCRDSDLLSLTAGIQRSTLNRVLYNKFSHAWSDQHDLDHQDRQLLLVGCLHVAIYHDDHSQVDELLPMINDLNQKSALGSSAGFNALHVAGQLGRAQLMRRLLGEPLSMEIPDDNFGQTALHHACVRGHADTASALLELGAKPDALALWGNYKDFDAFQIACDMGWDKIVNDMLENGHIADPDYDMPDNCRNKGWMQPLQLAVYKGHQSIVKTLLKHGARVLQTVPTGAYQGYDALHLAVDRSESGIVNMLVDEIEEPRFNEPANREDQFALTPVQIAILSRQFRIARTLVSYGANINQPLPTDFYKGFYLMHLATKTGDHVLLNKLIELGADINVEAQNDSRQKPYQFIVFKPNMDPEVFQTEQANLLALLKAGSLDRTSKKDICSCYFTNICALHNSDNETYPMSSELITHMIYNGLDIAQLKTINNLEYAIDDDFASGTPLRLMVLYDHLSNKNYTYARRMIEIHHNLWLGFNINGKPLLHELIQKYHQSPNHDLFLFIQAVIKHPNVDRHLRDNKERFDYQSVPQGADAALWLDWQQRLFSRLSTPFESNRNLLELMMTERVTAGHHLAVETCDGKQGTIAVNQAKELVGDILSALNQKLQAKRPSIHPRLMKLVDGLIAYKTKQKSDLILLPQSLDGHVERLQNLISDLQCFNQYLADDDKTLKRSSTRIQVSHEFFEAKTLPHQSRKRPLRQTRLSEYNMFNSFNDQPNKHAKYDGGMEPASKR